MTIQEWSERWQLPSQALTELAQIGLPEDHSPSEQSSEGAVQVLVRLKASKAGMRLWRNNVGAFKAPEGMWVRYGLCNESKLMNSRIKSSDLVGINSVTITPDMVGRVIGQFVAREVKHSTWKFKPNDPHTKAQKKFIDIVNQMGGDASFTTGDL